MPSQSYANHIHRPRPTAVAFLFVIVAITGFVLHWLSVGMEWRLAMALAALTASVVTLIAISRLYIVRLQNRIIKLEMRVRAATVLTPEQQRALRGLDLSKLVALRFASDEELPALLDRAVREPMTPKEIKQAVKNWVPDFDRT